MGLEKYVFIPMVSMKKLVRLENNFLVMSYIMRLIFPNKDGVLLAMKISSI